MYFHICHCIQIFFRVCVILVFLPSVLCNIWYHHETKNVNNVRITIWQAWRLSCAAPATPFCAFQGKWENVPVIDPHPLGGKKWALSAAHSLLGTQAQCLKQASLLLLLKRRLEITEAKFSLFKSLILMMLPVLNLFWKLSITVVFVENQTRENSQNVF